MSTALHKLPQKENAIFKKIVKCYESKQYKPALKFSRQILANPKFAEHGETLAMKGLVLNTLGRTEEGLEFVKKGLKNDLSSGVCWHVYGLVQRTIRKHDESIKCYRNAVKWDKENIQIYRDLAVVQLQVSDLEGFNDSRYNLLKLRPSQQGSWMGFALSYYLLKDYTMALKVTAEYKKTMIPTKGPYEYSELVLFEASMMAENGRHLDVLRHLIEYEPVIFHSYGVSEIRGSVYLAVKHFSEAEVIYRELIHRNPENYHYHRKLEEAMELDSDEAKVTHYLEMGAQYPRSHVIRRMPLIIASGKTFADLMDKFLQNSLKKGVPSIFVSIKLHYQNPEKVRIIEELVSGYVDSLRKCDRLELNGPGPPEPPSTLLWTIVLMAQHYDAVGQALKSMELINEAIEHTPTDIQLYLIKAKIYKHGGEPVEAAKWMEEARIMDTADRFVNCKCVKYFLRVDRIERGVEIAGLFTREGPPTLETMDDMQCKWFQTEIALAYRRVGKLGEALKKFHEIEQHFTDIIDDHYDFHGYAMRKITMNAYVKVLESAEKLRVHHFYVKSVKNLIEMYIYLHDHPEAKTATMNGPVSSERNLSSAEQKKLQRKERKVQRKAQAKAMEEKKGPAENKAHSKEDKGDEKKPKFVAKDLLDTENPLDEAIKLLPSLQLETLVFPHLLAYAIHSRRRKFMLMLQSIKRARAVAAENGEVHSVLVDFLLAYEAEKSKLPSAVQEVIEVSRRTMTEGKELVDLNRDFLKHHQDSLEHVIPASQVLYRLQPNSRDSAISYATNLSDTMKGRTLKNCAAVQKLLRSHAFGPTDPALIKTYEEKCSELFPFATAFRLSAAAEATPSNCVGDGVKEMVGKGISASGSHTVLKQTALSTTAMSDLSGDINDVAKVVQEEIQEEIQETKNQ